APGASRRRTAATFSVLRRGLRTGIEDSGSLVSEGQSIAERARRRSAASPRADNLGYGPPARYTRVKYTGGVDLGTTMYDMKAPKQTVSLTVCLGAFMSYIVVPKSTPPVYFTRVYRAGGPYPRLSARGEAAERRRARSAILWPSLTKLPESSMPVRSPRRKTLNVAAVLLLLAPGAALCAAGADPA